MVVDPTYDDVRTFIRFHLRPYFAQLKFLPGDRERMIVRTISAPITQTDESTSEESLSELQSVTLDGVELMRDLDDHTGDPWARLLRRSKLSQEDIKAKISEDLAIPKWALFNEFAPPIPGDTQLVVPEGLELHPKLALEVANQQAQV